MVQGVSGTNQVKWGVVLWGVTMGGLLIMMGAMFLFFFLTWWHGPWVWFMLLGGALSIAAWVAEGIREGVL